MYDGDAVPVFQGKLRSRIMEDVAYPAIVYGSLTSLYNTLDIASVLLLEKAILYRNIRNFSISLTVFDSFPVSVAVQPAVVVEHTWTLIVQYRFREARTIATKGLSAFRSDSAREKHDGPAILLRAMSAGLDALIEGSMGGCYESLGEIYAWLNNVPLTDFTDVQVL